MTVTFDRGGLESDSFELVDCQGRPLSSALARLTALARPWGAARPPSAPLAPAEAPRGAAALPVRLDPGLLLRLDAITRRFAGKTVSIVSGLRPESRGSLHAEARALDFQIVGVRNEDVVAFCKTLPDTGCGYYPNSSFVHLDVRPRGAGNASWIDASGPGEAPRYVTRWPPPAQEAVQPLAEPSEQTDDFGVPEHDPWLLRHLVTPAAMTREGLSPAHPARSPRAMDAVAGEPTKR